MHILEISILEIRRSLRVDRFQQIGRLQQTALEVVQPAQAATGVDVEGLEGSGSPVNAVGRGAEFGIQAVEGAGGVVEGHVGRVELGAGGDVAVDGLGEGVEVTADAEEVVAEAGC